MSSASSALSKDSGLIVSGTGSGTGSGKDDVSGTVTQPVTLENANAMSEAGEQYIAGSSQVLVHIDMQNVEATSVAVAVVLAWLAVAARCGKELCLANLSSDFSDLVEFSGISSMFAEHIHNPS